MARDDASGGSCPGCGAALPAGERLCSRCEVHWARHEAEADGLEAVECAERLRCRIRLGAHASRGRISVPKHLSS